MDLSNLCRSCMKEVASWEKENFSKRAVDMFCFCTNIKITDEEQLPKQFCYDCIIKIESAYMFIQEAQNVNITLRNIVSRSETKVIIEPESFKQIELPEKPLSNLKLTLPDYKLCSTIISNTEHKTVPNNISTKEISNSIEEKNDQYEKLVQDTITEELPPNVEELEPEPCTQKNVDIAVNISEKKNVCPVCRKSFTSKVWFAKHMENEHSGRKYSCAHCPKTFAKPSQVAYHSASHSDERKFVCNVCGKRFKLRKQLMTHARGHSDVRPYACDKCNMRFKMKSILKCHMKVHEDKKEHLCSFCGWSFAQASNLEVHLRKHTGDKPYTCSSCVFRAASASSLRRHERRHQDARIYVCKHCRKGFFDASALARHTRTHTGELPYQCPGCARAFADSWKRKTHLMRAHRLALHDIPRLRRDGRPVLPADPC
ncbi:uncharacterized protein [Epargyreus clarus]|uniref:uncharacterized protein n=1 Tax=Epargyreus clarus TaxID=520877 RepID=UPI003C30614F